MTRPRLPDLYRLAVDLVDGKVSDAAAAELLERFGERHRAEALQAFEGWLERLVIERTYAP